MGMDRRTFIYVGATALATGAVGLGLAGCSSNGTSSNSSSSGSSEASSPVVSVEDFTGDSIEVNTMSNALATIAGPAYEKVFMLGQADRIISTMAGGSYKNAWANLLNPNLANLNPVDSPDDPNIEALVADGVEVVFHFNNQEVLTKMKDAGLTALAVLPGSTDAASGVEDFIANLKREVGIYGNPLALMPKRRHRNGAITPTKNTPMCKLPSRV